MSSKLASDIVYSETSHWTVVGVGMWGLGYARSMNPYSERHGKQITYSMEPLRDMVSRLLAVACFITVHNISLTT